jgi:hypothetical protein
LTESLDAQLPGVDFARLSFRTALMVRYKVCFDGKWQGKFDRDDALEWARDVAETGRLVVVVKRRGIVPPKLVAVFPEDRAEEGRRQWRYRATGMMGGGGGGF